MSECKRVDYSTVILFVTLLIGMFAILHTCIKDYSNYYFSKRLEKFKIENQNEYQIYIIDHKVIGEGESVKAKEVIKFNSKTGKTEILMTKVEDGKRIDFWIPVFESEKLKYGEHCVSYSLCHNVVKEDYSDLNNR